MCRNHLKLGIGMVSILTGSTSTGQYPPDQNNALMHTPSSNSQHVQAATPVTSMPQVSEKPLISATIPITTTGAETSTAASFPALPTPPVAGTTNVPPSAPQPATVEPAATPAPAATKVMDEQTEDAAVGIDTMDVKGETKGNWLFKRHWWERARKLYDEIINRVKIVDAERDAFAEQYSKILMTTFADFYRKSGYQQGELVAALTMLKNELDEQRKKVGELDEQERAAFSALEKEKEQLDQLQTAAQAIDKLALLFDEALKMLNHQVALCSTYEQQADQQLREIERELSDKQAKESYHQMRTSFENIITIEQYIKADFATYFTTLTNKTKEHIDAVMIALATLKEHGVDVTKQVESLRTKKCALENPAQPEPAKAEADSGHGMFSWLSSAWDAVYQWIRSFWTSKE